MSSKATKHAEKEGTEEKQKVCFVMMPISDVDGYKPRHFDEVYTELIVPAVEAAGYTCTLATSTKSAHMIQLDVVSRVVHADLCICDLSTNNPNVLFEYGIRQAFDKPTVLIKDDITRRIFDLNGFRDIEYDHTLRIANILRARAEITRAIQDTVEGNEDGAQVFSLVKLLKLTSAASLPMGDISPIDAKFKLMEAKFDTMLRTIQATNRQNTLNQRAVSKFPITARNYRTFLGSLTDEPDTINGRWVFEVKDGLITITDNLKGGWDVIKGLDDLESHPIWEQMTATEKEALLAKCKAVDSFIPF